MSIACIKEVRRDFSRAAPSYDAYAALQRSVLDEVVHLLLPHLTPQENILDAGCGTGYSSYLIPHGGIIGIDLALPMCMQAKSGMRAICADICHLPLKTSSMDAALCSLVLQWVENVPSAISELFRVVSHGGYAAIAIFGEQTLKELRDVLGEERVHNFPPLYSLLAQAKAAGWEEAAIISRNYRHEYASLHALMLSLKNIGAANKQPERPRGLTTPGAFQRAEARYRAKYGNAEKIHATWEVHYLLLRKPEQNA